MRTLFNGTVYKYIATFIAILFFSFLVLFTAGLFSSQEKVTESTCITSWGETC